MFLFDMDLERKANETRRSKLLLTQQIYKQFLNQQIIIKKNGIITFLALTKYAAIGIVETSYYGVSTTLKTNQKHIKPMVTTEIVNIFSTFGFPTAMVIVMGYAMWKMYKRLLPIFTSAVAV